LPSLSEYSKKALNMRWKKSLACWAGRGERAATKAGSRGMETVSVLGPAGALA